MAAFDERLAARVRQLLEGESGITERRMFGGLAFLVDGAMAVAASGQGGLMVGVDPDEVARLLRQQGVSRVVMRGRTMRGWLRVDASALKAKARLVRWVERGLTTARSR